MKYLRGKEMDTEIYELVFWCMDSHISFDV